MVFILQTILAGGVFIKLAVFVFLSGSLSHHPYLYFYFIKHLCINITLKNRFLGDFEKMGKKIQPHS